MIPEWCHFAHEGILCHGHDAADAVCAPIAGARSRCAWPNAPRDRRAANTEPVAVIFSDRLVQTGMVTMTSLCRHESELTVLVFTRIGADFRPLPQQYLSCRVVTMSLSGAIAHLRTSGWQPESICDPPGHSRLGAGLTGETLIGALAWDRDDKHASCANHLRFYLPEFPALRRTERVLFVDDDVVIMRDPVKNLYHHRLPPGILLTANCDVNSWNDRCQRFDVGRPQYAHFFSNMKATKGAWERVLGALRDASLGAASAYDPSHHEWNFGFNLMELRRHRQVNFTAVYERLTSRVLTERYVRGDSLIYGLGMPFLAYQGRVECYERSGFFVLDGLGYVPPVEMQVAGVSHEVIQRAGVLHFNGERKPWGEHPFAEYMEAMEEGSARHSVPSPSKGRGGGSSSNNNSGIVEVPLDLVVLLSSPRSGTEWLSKVMSDDQGTVCGSIGLRTAPHPESLMPFNVVCSNASEVPCTAWRVEELSNSSCDLRTMCHWRYVIAAARGASVTTDEQLNGVASNSGSMAAGRSRLGAKMFEHSWRRWGRERRATDIFEGYLRRMLRMPTSAPELPCACEPEQRVLFIKFFLSWLEPEAGSSKLAMPGNEYQRRFAVSGGASIAGGGHDEAWNLVDVRSVFERLGARFVSLTRDPISTYLSIQKGRAREAHGDGDSAWHCFGEDEQQGGCAAQKGHTYEEQQARVEVDVRDAGYFVADAKRLQGLAPMFGAPVLSLDFDACVRNASACIGSVYSALQLPARDAPIPTPRVSTSSARTVINREAIDEMLRDVEAGNWSYLGRRVL
jgi:hypothetical protein